MIEAARDWLPLGVAVRDAVRNPIEQAIELWANQWFARRRLRVGAYEAIPSKGGARLPWRQFGQAVAVAQSQPGRLALLALDADTDGCLPTERDSRLIEAFETSLFGDLADRVARALGLEPVLDEPPRLVEDPFGRDGGVKIEIVETNRVASLTIAIPLEAMLPACRRTLPPRSAKTMSLSPRVGALTETSVEIEAVLGRAKVTIEELGHLAVGDVLVLDTPLDGLAEVIRPRTSDILAHARLSEDAGSIALTLQP